MPKRRLNYGFYLVRLTTANEAGRRTKPEAANKANGERLEAAESVRWNGSDSGGGEGVGVS